MFYQQDCIIIHNQETKILKKEFFTSNFDGNAQQLAGLSPGDSKTGVMEDSERLFETLQKYISDFPIWLRMCCKFISSIAFI